MKLLSLLLILALAAGTLGAAPDFDARELARRGGKKRGGGKGSRWPEGCDPSGLKDALKEAKGECQAACIDSDGAGAGAGDGTNEGNRMLKKKGGKGGEGKEYQECKKAVLSEIFSEVKETCRETCAEAEDDESDDDDEAINGGGGGGAPGGSNDAEPRECMQKCLSEECGLNKGKDRMLRRGGKGDSEKGRRPDGEKGQDESDRPNKRECILGCAKFCGARKPKRPDGGSGVGKEPEGPNKAQRKAGGRGGKGGKKPSACLKECFKTNKPSKADVEDAFNAADCVDPFACERSCVSGKREQWLSANGCAKPEDDE